MVENTVAAFEDYLTEYPEGEFTEATRQLLYQQLYKQYGEINEKNETALIAEALSAWQAYKVKYPNSSYRHEIDVEIAKLAGKKRKEVIKKLSQNNPKLAKAFKDAKHDADAQNKFIRESNRYSLTAVGKINTYAVFAETVKKLISVEGRLGIEAALLG